jgi:trimeric autotransporter adhesin
MNHELHIRKHCPAPVLSALAALLLASLASPARADDPCRDANGDVDFTISTDQGAEHGFRNATCHPNASAYGIYNTAAGSNSSAFGYQNFAIGTVVSAFGYFNQASGTYTSAFGYWNVAYGDYSSAFGNQGWASGDGSIAVAGWYDRDGDGYVTRSDLNGDGYDEASLETAYASGTSAVAFGAGVVATGDRSSAVGVDNTSRGADSSAFGRANLALGDGDAAFGSNNNTGVNDFFSLSGNNAALGVGNTATGGFATFIDSPKYSSAAVGAGNQATGGNSSALGVENIASGINSTAIGYASVASADDSTAIGSNSMADRANTLSVGAVGAERQIVNVADATEATDAVNLGQLVQVGNTLATGVATVLGGGAAWNPLTGTFTAPTYVIQNNNYSNVGAAFAAVDGALDDLDTRIGNAGGIQGEQGESAYEVAVNNGFAGSESDWLDSLQGEQGPAGPTGPEGPAGGGPESVQYDDSSHAQLTLSGADGTRISNVANAVEAGDAVNLGQMQAGDAATLTSAQTYADAGDADTLASANEYTDNTATETLTSANAYTDQRFAELTGLSTDFEAFRGEVDDRFHQQDRRIDKMSSISGAYAGMAMNTSGLAGRNRIGVGVGAQGGERALAVGYQRAIGNRASVSIAGAFSGDEKSVSAGAGFSW